MRSVTGSPPVAFPVCVRSLQAFVVLDRRDRRFSLDRCFEIGLDWRAAKQGTNKTTNKTEMMWR
jgi:hypothetical protein